MVIKVGINGFGRIGKVIFRTCLQNPDIELSAINDPAIDIEYICYLIKFDSTHGKFKGNITHTKNEININDRIIKVFHDKQPHTVPWQVAGVQYVVEASGMFTCLEKSSGHLASDGVKRVIVTAPSVDVPMIILGVNDNKLNPEQKVLSCASSTLYCLAPIVKVLEDNFGVAEGFITSIHAMTPSLKPLDGLCLRGKHWRDHRSIHQNIIPASTGSCKALAKIIPQVKDKMAGLAFRVPIVNVSVLDMTVRLDTNTNLQDIINTVENAGRTCLRNIIKISNNEAVSSDFSGDSHSCILDADSSLQLKPNFYKIICWYENEYSYACRVIDSIFFSERQFNTPVRLPCKMTYVRAKLTKKQDEVQQTERTTEDIESIECNADVPKCSSSIQETIYKKKPPVRPVVLRKPLSTHNSGIPVITPAANRDAKKRNELFKIWNDNYDAQKNVARQQRSAFFHSCMAFAPKPAENIDCMKPQERLENVKKEFSKMVNITEDLLKKSNASKVQLGSAPKSSEGVKLGGNGGSKDSKTNIKGINSPTNNSLRGICSDYKNTLSASPNDCSNEAERCCSSSDRNDNNSEYKISSAVRKIVINKPYLIPPREQMASKAKQNPITDFGLKVENNLSAKVHDSLKLNSKYNTTMHFRAPITKKENNFMDSLSNKSPVQSAMKEQKGNSKSSDAAVKHDVEEKKMEVKIAEGSGASPHVPTETNASITQAIDTPEQIPHKDIEDYLQRKDYNIRIIDEALQKRNIVLVNSEISNQSNNSELNCQSSDISAEQINIETKTSGKSTNKQIQETLNRKVNKQLNNSELNCQSNDISCEQLNIETKTLNIETKTSGKSINKQILETLNRKVNQKLNNSELNCQSCDINCEQLNIETKTSGKSINKQILETLNRKVNQKLNNSELNCKSSNLCAEQMNIETKTCGKSINKQIPETLNRKVNQKLNNSELNCKLRNISREQLIKETEIRGKKLNKQILDALNKRVPGPVVIVPVETSGGLNPEKTAKAVNNGASTKMKLDLYDKLDSASASDSTNSFEINERKSQVIQICDLTNSIEDLTRLDKICRIIEISDELSDKLFSSLDQTELTGLQQKTWSFRDLCERIKLDEFCNKVFGKSKS